ncbi:hypothetical protein TCON_1194 [Astathelohania contejeani]|uniref:Fam-b protein n=1 Tax=Astathelohania contejeani TaxID=164912 RepID=A0ABQ7HZR5_9MICR|nr:hypothetical protein TCON_1194 [Thelohania contejeani]
MYYFLIQLIIHFRIFILLFRIRCENDVNTSEIDKSDQKLPIENAFEYTTAISHNFNTFENFNLYLTDETDETEEIIRKNLSTDKKFVMTVMGSTSILIMFSAAIVYKVWEKKKKFKIYGKMKSYGM